MTGIVITTCFAWGFAAPSQEAGLAPSAAALGQQSPARSTALHLPPPGRARRLSSASQDRGSNEDFLPVAAGAEIALAELTGPGLVTHLWLNVDSLDPYISRLLVLRMRWDDEEQPSVEVPVGDFFAVGHALSRQLDSALVRVSGMGRARSCTWPMPFESSAIITLRNDSNFPVAALYYAVDWLELDESHGPALRTFHASYRQSAAADPESEFALADIRGTGHYVGTVLSIAAAEAGWPGEGDDRFYIDDERNPSLLGTGIEDYFQGGWGLSERAGDGSGATVWEGFGPGARSTAYRWHLRDPIPFQQSLKVTFERMGWARRGADWELVVDRADQFSGVAIWYQEEPHQPYPPLPLPPRRLPFFEHRMEFEEDLARLETVEGGPRPVLREDRFLAYGAGVLLDAGDPENAQLRLPFVAEVERTCLLVICWSRRPDSPVVEVFLDGEPLAGPCDLYAEREQVVEQLLGQRLLTEGSHVLHVKAVGKNPASAGYRLAFDGFALRW